MIFRQKSSRFKRAIILGIVRKNFLRMNSSDYMSYQFEMRNEDNLKGRTQQEVAPQSVQRVRFFVWSTKKSCRKYFKLFIILINTKNICYEN